MKPASSKKITNNPSNDISNIHLFDPKEGEITDLVFNNRAAFTNEELWGRIQAGLFSILKSNAAVILYQIGLEYGLAVGTTAREQKQKIDEAIEFLKIYGYLAGWGQSSFS